MVGMGRKEGGRGLRGLSSVPSYTYWPSDLLWVSVSLSIKQGLKIILTSQGYYENEIQYIKILYTPTQSIKVSSISDLPVLAAHPRNLSSFQRNCWSHPRHTYSELLGRRPLNLPLTNFSTEFLWGSASPATEPHTFMLTAKPQRH